MDNIKFFLKFGKKEHLKELTDGFLYFSNATTFWNIEDNMKIKGQGDALEATARVFAHHLVAKEEATGNMTSIEGNIVINTRFQPVELTPIFCLFAVREKDIITTSNKFGICLSGEIKRTIKEHFPEADSVAVIKDPHSFIIDIENSIGYDIKYDNIHYFNISDGILDENTNTRNIDIGYYRYIAQDTPPEEINGGRKYKLKAKYAYRVLFCKDIFFLNEQEFRIIIPAEEISYGKKYPVKINQTIDILPIEELIK